MEVDGTSCITYPVNVLQLILTFRFAVERTDTEISVWFWDRSSFFVPHEVKWGLDVVHPYLWVCEIFICVYLR